MKTPQRDANESAMVQALRDRSFLVQQLHQGDGVPDLLVWSPFARRMALLEVKDPAKKPSARKLTPAQVRWHRRWADAPVYVVETVDDALAVFGEAVRAVDSVGGGP